MVLTQARLPFSELYLNISTQACTCTVIGSCTFYAVLRVYKNLLPLLWIQNINGGTNYISPGGRSCDQFVCMVLVCVT